MFDDIIGYPNKL